MVWEGDYMVHANTTKQSGPIRWVCFPPLKFMGWMGLCPWQGGSKADGREICRETKSPTMYQTWWGWYKLNAAWYLEEMQMNDLLIQLWPKYGFSEPGYHPPPLMITHTHTRTHREKHNFGAWEWSKVSLLTTVDLPATKHTIPF